MTDDDVLHYEVGTIAEYGFDVHTFFTFKGRKAVVSRYYLDGKYENRGDEIIYEFPVGTRVLCQVEYDFDEYGTAVDAGVLSIEKY